MKRKILLAWSSGKDSALALHTLQRHPPGVDPCGEYGEFHSFVYDCPMFRQPMNITLGETVYRHDAVFVDITAGSC